MTELIDILTSPVDDDPRGKRPKIETKLVNQLLAELRRQLPGYVIFKHADRATFGIPDISITGCGRTLWLEVKHANPTLETMGIQWRTCAKLHRAGLCRYVVYFEQVKTKRLLILTPEEVQQPLDEFVGAEGFDHNYVVRFARETLV